MTSESVNFFFLRMWPCFLKTFKRDWVHLICDECEMNKFLYTVKSHIYESIKLIKSAILRK